MYGNVQRLPPNNMYYVNFDNPVTTPHPLPPNDANKQRYTKWKKKEKENERHTHSKQRFYQLMA